jgi:hypothetical protein
MKVNIPIYDLDKILSSYGTNRHRLGIALDKSYQYYFARKKFTIKKKGVKSFNEDDWKEIVAYLKTLKRRKKSRNTK